jgi:ligand-binding sensor domain-containing protein
VPIKLQEIEIDTAKQTKPDFSIVAGKFEKVYSNVHNGFRDNEGKIWFGTAGNIYRYDGKNFINIPITGTGSNPQTSALKHSQGISSTIICSRVPV